jgi:agmatinase/guanidinopropionase
MRCADVGDCKIIPLSLEKSYELIENHVTQILSSKKRLLSIGGDHSITLPILRSFKKRYGSPLNLIHFDAHLDTYPAAWGCDYHHGSFLRHAIDEELVNPLGTIQIGVRGPFAGQDDLDFVREKGVQVITNEMIKINGLPEVTKELKALSGPTYVSFDIDCLDPAYAPGTGTPVPGGLTTFEAQYIIRQLKGYQIVGGDVVEISPPYDHCQITALAGMDAAFEILSLMALSSD